MKEINAKKGLGSKIFMILMMIFFYAFAAGHPLARSFFIAVILQ